jgi:hypothetical protein
MESMKKQDALEGEAGKRPILVMKESEQFVQLDHCVCKYGLVAALNPELLKEMLAPRLGDRVVFHIPLVANPETKVRVLLRKMVAQFLNLLSWGR